MRRTFLPPRQPWSRGAASLWWARFGTVLALLTLHVGLHAQRDASVEELREEAALAFEAQSWGKAHRAYAELLSLDGTSVQLQMRYAATLLHDERLVGIVGRAGGSSGGGPLLVGAVMDASRQAAPSGICFGGCPVSS